MKISVIITCGILSTAIAVPHYERGLTDHFIDWLNNTGGYESFNFNRTSFIGGSFGGKTNDSTPITRRPVIFIHGTSD
jgi:hypothetical protein